MTDPGAAEHWARVQEALNRLLELSPAERSAALAREPDATLAAELRELLAAFDDGPLGDPQRQLPAEWVGDWRLLGLLGEGGMGAVYHAEREREGFRQRAALKLVRPGIVDPALAGRFVAERRILARLEHPGIARLIDGGTTPAGQPWLAMEFVEGRTLTKWAGEARPDLDVRLKLFAEVCDAVHHAHQELVVHRDLKPGNILVDAEGRPRLLDFGVARLLDPSDGMEHVTGTAPWITPAYASPEQARGRRVGTPTDVYSLGVILYELLAGERPHKLEGLTPAQITATLTEKDPPPPSQRLADPRARREVAGDLDVIALKAMARDPARRYASAEQLADDVRRYLAGRPVLARPDSAAYRLRKFVGRHRTAVIAGAVALVLLVLGAIGTIWQANAARRAAETAAAEARRAERVSSLLVTLFRLSDPTQMQGDTLSARGLLDQGTARIEREFGDEPEVQAQLFAEVARVYANLGIFDRAESLLRRALELRGPDARPGDVAPTTAQLGAILVDHGRAEEGIEMLERALRLGGMSDTLTAEAQARLAWALRDAGQHEEAAALFARSLATRRATLGDADPRTASTLLGLAAAEHDLGRFDAAERLFGDVLANDSLRKHPTPAAATALLQVGFVRRLRERYHEAEPLVQAGWEMRRALYEPGHPERLAAAGQWGAMLLDLARYPESEAVLREGLAEAEVAGLLDHPEVASLRETLSLTLVVSGQFAEGLALGDDAIARKRREVGDDHPAVTYSRIHAADMQALAFRQGESRRRYEELLAAMQARDPDGQSVARFLVLRGLAQAALMEGRTVEAARLQAQADTIGRALLREGHRYRLRLVEDQAALALAQGRTQEARRLAREALAGRRATYQRPHDRTGRALVLLASAELADGETAAAREHLGMAMVELGVLPPAHWRVGEAMSLLGLAECRLGLASEGQARLEEGRDRIRAHLGATSPVTRRAGARLAWCAGETGFPDAVRPLELGG